MKAKATFFMVLMIFLFSPSAYGDYGDWDGPYQEEGINAGYHSGGTPDPRIIGWASEVVDYWRPDGITFGTPDLVLGQPGGTYDIFSLGDGGWVTVGFDQPVSNGPGPDLAVWENGFINSSVPPLGMLFAELVFVEVSSDGVHFARFPSVCLNPATEPIGGFGCIDPTYYHYVGGKHPNGNDSRDEGTPFDLEDLQEDPLVLDGSVDLNNILFVKLIDVIGDGSTFDSLGNPMWDPYPTPFSSGGADVDAICVLKDVYVLHLGIDEETDVFPQELTEESYYSGVAAAKQTLRWVYGNDGGNPPEYNLYDVSQTDLYNYYHMGESGQDMDADDIRTLIQTEKPTTTPSYAYNFSAKADDDEDMAIKRFIHWCDFNVQTYYPSGTGINEPQVPSLIVSSEDTYGYQWKTLRGFAMDVDPCDDANVFNIPDMTVYGLWLNDPAIGGLGYNVYVTGEEFKDMYEQADGKYRSVVEPPEGVDVMKVEASLKKAKVSYKKGKRNELLANVLKDLRVQKAASAFPDSFSEAQTVSFQPLYDGIRWDEIIPRELLNAPGFKNIYSESGYKETLQVADLDDGKDYGLAVFSRSKDRTAASIVLIVEKEDGKFRQATWDVEGQVYLPVSRTEAVKIATKALGLDPVKIYSSKDIMASEGWKVRLAYSKEYCQSPFFPMYEVSMNGGVAYVYQDGSFEVEKVAATPVKTVKVEPLL